MIFTDFFKRRQEVLKTVDLDSYKPEQERTRINPEDVLKARLKTNIRGYDPYQLGEAKQATYHKACKEVLDNIAFKNELASMQEQLISEIVFNAKDFGEVRDMRMTLNALEILKDRLNSVTPPDF